jgi:hypothetical protein
MALESVAPATNRSFRHFVGGLSEVIGNCSDSIRKLYKSSTSLYREGKLLPDSISKLFGRYYIYFSMFVTDYGLVCTSIFDFFQQTFPMAEKSKPLNVKRKNSPKFP